MTPYTRCGALDTLEILGYPFVLANLSDPSGGVHPYHGGALPLSYDGTWYACFRKEAQLYKQIRLFYASLFDKNFALQNWLNSPFGRAHKNKERLNTVDPDVIGAVGHTVRLAAPKVRRDGSHKFCRPFVDRHSKLVVDTRQALCEAELIQSRHTKLGGQSPPLPRE